MNSKIIRKIIKLVHIKAQIRFFISKDLKVQVKIYLLLQKKSLGNFKSYVSFISSFWFGETTPFFEFKLVLLTYKYMIIHAICLGQIIFQLKSLIYLTPGYINTTTEISKRRLTPLFLMIGKVITHDNRFGYSHQMMCSIS